MRVAPRHGSMLSPGRVLPFIMTGVVVLLNSCAQRGYQDGLELTDEQSHARFLASGELTPESDVVVLAQAPPLRYGGGVLEITGGSELMVVQPQAWREYTGTALSVEEASRELARARRLEAALHDLGISASALLERLRKQADSPEPDAKVVVPADPPTAPAGAGHSRAPTSHSSPHTSSSATVPASQLSVTTLIRSRRDLDLQQLSDQALDRLEHLLMDAKRDEANAISREQCSSAVANADAMDADDRREQNHTIALVAAGARGVDYQQDLARAQSRQVHSHPEQEHQADGGDQEFNIESRARSERLRLAITNLHHRSAQDLQQCCAHADSDLVKQATTPTNFPAHPVVTSGDEHDPRHE
jgi:hypothetical protein